MMIPTIPTPDELLDKGFSRGKKASRFNENTKNTKASERKKKLKKEEL